LARAARRFWQNLRGRKTVRADRRLRTDEKCIRAQATILDKTPTPCLVFTLALLLAATKMTKIFAWMWQLSRSNCIAMTLPYV